MPIHPDAGHFKSKGVKVEGYEWVLGRGVGRRKKTSMFCQAELCNLTSGHRYSVIGF